MKFDAEEQRREHAPRRPSRTWVCRDREILLGPRTRIMGVVNCTPDSFSDGGRYLEADAAFQHALQLVEAGADLLDLGGESSRPGAAAVSEAEEIRRVIPVVDRLAREVPHCLLSVDTVKSGVARAALEAGAHVINDISAGTLDPELPQVVREFAAGYVIMHMRGTPRTMQEAPQYADVVRDVKNYLSERKDALCAAGLNPSTLVADPGIGFGKTLPHNLALLREQAQFHALGIPLLIGLSRKSFLGEVTDRDVEDRLAGSLSGLAWSIARGGAHILRVHEVKESCDAARLLDILLSEKHDAF